MYNQPFSQSPGMFGSQSGGAQMQSAPSLPPGNAPGREYFNHSMATFTNAMQPPTGMVPQGISSLVPGYFWGGGVGLGADADTSGNVDIDWGSVSAAIDAAAADAAADADADADAGSYDPSIDAGGGAPTGVSYTAPGQDAAAPGQGADAGSYDPSIDAGGGAPTAPSYDPSIDAGGGAPPAPGQDAAPFDIGAILASVDSQRGGPPATQDAAPFDIEAINAFLAGLSPTSTVGTDQFSQGQGTQGSPTSGATPDIDFSNLALNALQDRSDDLEAYYDSRVSAATDPEYAGSRQDMYNFLVNDYKGNVVTGTDEITKAEDLNKGFVNSLIKGLTPFQQGPLYNPATGSMTGGTYVDRGGAAGAGLGSLVGGPFGGLVGGLLGSGRGGYAPVNSIMGGNSGGFGNPDMEGLPSVGVDISEPDAGDPDGDNGGDPNGDPNGGNGGGSGGSDPNTSQYALNPLVYQAYANLGLPVLGNVPPYRRVNIPTSRFVV